MKAFVKKIRSFLFSNHVTDEIEQLQIKKRQLETKLRTLSVIEKELLETKKVVEEPLKDLYDAE